ncbi:hypothetical protein ACFT0G_18350, partial [Streptomyces sp. NPDC057020]|uniref:hypothetical protein n=1 Tax=Streptomyces sp. NPDC057020 TaxID=3346002 RepID=UPI00363CADC6
GGRPAVRAGSAQARDAEHRVGGVPFDPSGEPVDVPAARQGPPRVGGPRVRLQERPQTRVAEQDAQRDLRRPAVRVAEDEALIRPWPTVTYG